MSVYEDIIDKIRRDIELGIYREGERLPSCREYALKIGVNPNTVQRAYTNLEADGYVYSVPKKGVYALRANEINKLNEAEKTVRELKRAGISKEQISGIINEVYKDD